MNESIAPPDKLSDLIELAVAEAGKLDHDVYEPNFGEWHKPVRAINRCCICLAGTLIAGPLRRSSQTTIDVHPISEEGTAGIEDTRWRNALEALDDARIGGWHTALEVLNITIDARTSDMLGNVEGPDWSDFTTWDEFGEHLKSIRMRAAELRELGL